MAKVFVFSRQEPAGNGIYEAGREEIVKGPGLESMAYSMILHVLIIVTVSVIMVLLLIIDNQHYCLFQTYFPLCFNIIATILNPGRCTLL